MIIQVNPPIYDLDKLLIYHVINKDMSDKKGILNKYIKLKQKTMFGFDNEWFPVACDYTVDVELPVKEGLFKDTVYIPSEAEELAGYLIENSSDEYKEMIIQLSDNQYEPMGEFSDIQKKYFKQLKNMKSNYVMSSSEMVDYLKNIVANKATRKRISKEYNL